MACHLSELGGELFPATCKLWHGPGFSIPWGIKGKRNPLVQERNPHPKAVRLFPQRTTTLVVASVVACSILPSLQKQSTITLAIHQQPTCAFYLSLLWA